MKLFRSSKVKNVLRKVESITRNCVLKLKLT